MAEAKLAEIRSLSVVQQYTNAKKSLKPFSAKSGDKKPIITLDNTPRIRICEKIKVLTGPDYEMFNCVVDGWCCLMKQYSDTVERTYDWMKEVKLLEAMPHHPNIVSYFFHGIIKSKLCILTSWYPTNLQAIINQRRHVRPETPNSLQSNPSHSFPFDYSPSHSTLLYFTLLYSTSLHSTLSPSYSIPFLS